VSGNNYLKVGEYVVLNLYNQTKNTYGVVCRVTAVWEDGRLHFFNGRRTTHGCSSSCAAIIDPGDRKRASPEEILEFLVAEASQDGGAEP